MWGVAYHIAPSRVKEVKEYLDIREMSVGACVCSRLFADHQAEMDTAFSTRHSTRPIHHSQICIAWCISACPTTLSS